MLNLSEADNRLLQFINILYYRGLCVNNIAEIRRIRITNILSYSSESHCNTTIHDLSLAREILVIFSRQYNPETIHGP